MTTEIWYRRNPNGRYTPVLQAELYNYVTTPADGFTLTFKKGGMTSYQYNVTPDTASFKAAATVCRLAMEEAIEEASQSSPHMCYEYSKKQLALIAKFKEDMGGMQPLWWTGSSARDVAQAGVDAVGNG